MYKKIKNRNYIIYIGSGLLECSRTFPTGLPKSYPSSWNLVAPSVPWTCRFFHTASSCAFFSCIGSWGCYVRGFLVDLSRHGLDDWILSTLVSWLTTWKDFRFQNPYFSTFSQTLHYYLSYFIKVQPLDYICLNNIYINLLIYLLVGVPFDH